jgi:hypothetical protein
MKFLKFTISHSILSPSLTIPFSSEKIVAGLSQDLELQYFCEKFNIVYKLTQNKVSI